MADLSLKDVANALEELTWLEMKELMIKLDVKLHILDGIEADRSGKDRNTHSIQYWLDNDLELSWERIISSLREIGKNVLAERVATRYYPQASVPVSDSHSSPLEELRQGLELRRQSTDSAFGSEGRQSISTISPQSSFSLSFSKQLSTEMLSEKEVKDEAKKFTTHFKEMVMDTQDALDDSKASPKKVINILLLSDTEFSNRYEHGGFLDTLKAAADILDLFAVLNRYWDHFNYHLLEQLLTAPRIERLFADKSLCQELQEYMKRYVEEMVDFRKRTAIDVYCKAVNQPIVPVPDGFKRLVNKIERTEMKTLQHVEEFRQKVAYEYKLHQCLVFLENIGLGSVVITLWVPQSVVLVDPLSEVGVFKDDGDNEGTSVDPFPLETESQANEDLPLEAELPEQTLTTKKAGEKTQVVKRKESLVSSVLSTVLPRSVIDPYILMTAVSSQNVEEVKNLIAKGSNLNVKPPIVDFTPLMEASRSGNTEITQLLLENGANPNMPNSENWTALMAATRNGRYAVVDLLLRHGAEPDMQDESGWSALMAAVYDCHEDIALRLIDAGATPHIQDRNETNALLLAISNNKQEKIVDALLDKNPELNIQDKYGETALIFACKMKNLRLVKRILSMGADPDIANKDGDTPLLIATERKEKQMVEELLKAKANPNLGAEPPIFLASSLGYKEISELLLDHGADPDLKDKHGVAAYEVAQLSNFTELAHRLNSQQLSSHAPGEILQLTKKAISELQSNLSRGPLFLIPTPKVGAAGRALTWILHRLPIH